MKITRTISFVEIKSVSIELNDGRIMSSNMEQIRIMDALGDVLPDASFLYLEETE